LPSPAIRGLFLDLDGTLADSMPVMRETYFRFLAARGAQGSQQEFDGLAGRPLSAISVLLKQAHGLNESPALILRAYLDTVEAIYAQEAQPMPGARELLQAAAERGVFTAVVTSATREQAQGFLRHHGLAGLVTAVVGAEQVRRGKPDPEPYRLALSLAGLDPAQGLAAEDSPIGAASALGAGLATYIVRQPGGMAAEVQGAAGYIHRLDELNHLLA
jgi:HAD superfamily hydrolase (TIGR01509 family)